MSTKHELLHCNEPHFQQETPSRCDVFDGVAIVQTCYSTTQKCSVNTVTLSSFPGLKDNYKAVLCLTSSGTRTDLPESHNPRKTRERHAQKGIANVPCGFLTRCHKRGRTVQSSDGRCTQTCVHM